MICKVESDSPFLLRDSPFLLRLLVLSWRIMICNVKSDNRRGRSKHQKMMMRVAMEHPVTKKTVRGGVSPMAASNKSNVSIEENIT